MSKAASSERKNAIVKTALALGFDDVRFVKNSLDGDKPTAAFLIKRYTPSDGKAGQGRIALSEYYPASQFGHENAHLFVEMLKKDFDIDAEMTNALDYKKEMVKTGGTLGINSLYYHPNFGSYISMRCVLIGAKILPDAEPAQTNRCETCGLCRAICPTGAIGEYGFERDKCLRNMMSEGLPEYARKHVYQLLGCELCQLCCPMNPADKKAPRTYDLKAVIGEQETKHLKKICGKNMATRTRLLTQGMAYAAAKGFTGALPDITKLTDDGSDRIREMAVWAKRELEG